MTEHFTRWDSTEFLKAEEDIGDYLEACRDEAGDDPAFIAKALGRVAKARETLKTLDNQPSQSRTDTVR